MTVTGQIDTFLAALGARHPDPSILAVVELVGPTMTKQAGIDGGEFWTFADRGADLSFDGDGRLTAVFLRPFDTDEYGVEYAAYPDMGQLIEGLSAQPDRGEVETVLGTPDDTTPVASLYRVGRNWVHVRFDDEDDVILVIVMDALPG